MTTIDSVAGEPTRPRQAATMRQAVRLQLRGTGPKLALGWLAIVVLTSVFASAVEPQNPLTQHLVDAYQGPGSAHLLGTDEYGRDLLSRLIGGGGYLLAVSLLPVAISFGLGVPAGLFVGYVAGRWDAAAALYVNILFSMPAMVVILAAAAITNQSLWAMCVVFGLLGTAGILRITRAGSRAVRDLLYVDAARVARLPRRRILLRHVLPNVAGPLVVQGFLVYSGTILFLSSLAFLQLGFDPDKPNWGEMAYDASQHLQSDPWLLVPIGVVLVLTVYAITYLGNRLLHALPSANRVSLMTPYAPLAAEAAEPDAESAAEDPDAIIEVKGLTVAFPTPKGDVETVRQVSFDVQCGGALGLVGESGSGKTLTALSILGLVPNPGRVTGGRILFGGLDLLRLTEREYCAVRGSRIGLIAQDPMLALDPCQTAGSHLVEVIRQHGSYSRTQARARALELLANAGIRDSDRVMRMYPHQLSGGMAQRVCIALALAGEPDLLVADEPTTALDVTVQAEILDLLRDLRVRLGLTLLVVTHDLGVVADLCTHAAVMRDGRIVEQGPVDEVLPAPSHEYTKTLLSTVAAAEVA